MAKAVADTDGAELQGGFASDDSDRKFKRAASEQEPISRHTTEHVLKMPFQSLVSPICTTAVPVV